MNKVPTVSVITPLYNSAQFAAVTIRSVLEQTFADWEMILVDDCSLDNSYELAQSFAKKDDRIKVVQLTENSGAAIARNTGIKAARGRFMAFLDSDDMWDADKLAKQLCFMENKRIPFSYSAYRKIDELGEEMGLVGVPIKLSYQDMLKTCYIGCLTAIYDTYYFGKVEMPLIRRRQDYGLWLRLLRKTDYAYGVNKPLATYRIRSGSISSKKVSTSTYTWRLYREMEKLSLMTSIYYFGHYAVRGMLRHRFPELAKKLGVLHSVDGASCE